MTGPVLKDVAMLTETTTTDTPAIRSDSGVKTELIDSLLLFSASQIAAEDAIGFQASRQKADWITLFRALAELTHVHAEAGDPGPRFSISFLQEKCADLDPRGRVYWMSDEDTARKKFTKAWDKLVEIFPRMDANQCQRAEKSRLRHVFFPIANRTGSTSAASSMEFVCPA